MSRDNLVYFAMYTTQADLPTILRISSVIISNIALEVIMRLEVNEMIKHTFENGSNA